MKKKVWLSALPVLLLLNACGNEEERAATRGSIILGDSSTIVTETDPAFLTNLVTDVSPQEFLKNAEAQIDVAPVEPTDDNKPIDSVITIAKTQEDKPQQATQAVTGGYSIDFGKGVVVTFTKVQDVKEFKKQNPEKESGVSYLITKGDLLNSDLIVTGLKKSKVDLRYVTNLALKSSKEELLLSTLGQHTSNWIALMGEKNKFSLDLLNKADFKKLTNKGLRNAVNKQAKSSKLNRQKINFWLDKLNKTRSQNDAPCIIKLNNAQFRISGTTSDGSAFFKTIRLDA